VTLEAEFVDWMTGDFMQRAVNRDWHVGASNLRKLKEEQVNNQ
jgi:hypothetical protein